MKAAAPPITTPIANDPVKERRVLPWEAPLTAIVKASRAIVEEAKVATPRPRVKKEREYRKSVSVSRGCYDKLKPAALAAGRSMSSIIESETARFFEGEDGKT